MKHFIPDNWQLWIMASLAFLILSAVVRTVTLNMGWLEFNANVAFIVTFGLNIVLYGTFQQLIQQFLTPKIERFIGRKDKVEVESYQTETVSSNELSKDEGTTKKIIIDYATARENKKRKNEQRVMELEYRIMKYIGDIMSIHLTPHQVEAIIDRVTEFLHTTSVPDFHKNDSIVLPDQLSTTDMMHFGWNIAKPFKKPNLHTAYFLKQVFAHTFRNTEVYTIEKKLRLSPLSGIIKIDPNIAQYGKSEVERPDETSARVAKSAKEIALADMNCDEMADIFNMEEVLIDSDY